VPSAALLPVAVSLVALVGVTLGMLGGGGSILTVPILVYVLGLPAHQAIATSLFVIVATSAAALATYARAGLVRFRIGLMFGVTSMAGAFVGGRFAHGIPGGLLLVGFGVVMLATSIAMLSSRRVVARSAGPSPLALAAQGLAVGAITGLLGAGGGFLIVPALVLLGNVPIREAIATSLFVILLTATAALVGHLGTTAVDPWVTGWISAAAVLGSIAGARLAPRVPAESLRHAFGWLVLAVATFLLVQEAPRALGQDVELSEDWAGVAAASVAIPAIAAGVRAVRQRAASPPRNKARAHPG
jgi:uncharacterized membrane protein YfcA